MAISVIVRGIEIPEDELAWRFSRSPGPGGQSVNTSDTRAELSYDLAGSDALPAILKQRALTALAGSLAGGVLTVAASEHRSQLRNREAAAARLASLLTEATAAPARPRGSAGWPRSGTGRASSGSAARPTISDSARHAGPVPGGPQDNQDALAAAAAGRSSGRGRAGAPVPVLEPDDVLAPPGVCR